MVMSLLETNDFIMQKKILSTHEHYDFLDLKGNKLGADGNLIQIPPKFVVLDAHGVELLHLQGKTFSLPKEFTICDSAAKRAWNNEAEVSQAGGGRILGRERRRRVYANLRRFH
jgi:uncharacterized protein YxjI